MKNHIVRPPKGYDDQRHGEGGTPLTPEEQIDVYIQQTIDVIKIQQERGRLDRVKGNITRTIQNMTQPEDTITLEHTEPS